MAGFQSVTHGRLWVHVMPTTKFKTRHVSVKVCAPIKPDTATSLALLPYIWMEGTLRLPSPEAVMRYADDLYGAVVRTGISKRGTMQVAETFASVPEETSLTNATGLFDEALKLAIELAFQPHVEAGANGQRRFPAQAFNRERALHQKRIDSIFDNKSALAYDRCFEEVCRDHPAGIPRLGRSSDLERITPESLYHTHRSLTDNGPIHVYVVGNISDAQRLTEQVSSAIEKVTSLTSPGSVAPIEAVPEQRGHPRQVTDAELVQQGRLNVGYRTGVSYFGRQYAGLMVCNGVLGGFPHSKLFTNVREKASLAYDAFSRLDGLTGVLVVQTGIDIAKYDQALEIILQQVTDVQQGRFTDEELSFTKQALANQFRQAADTPMSGAEVHFQGFLAGQQASLENLLSLVDQVTKDDIVEAAQTLQLDTIYFLRNQEVASHA